jgi:hypothetical protein
VVDGQQRFIRGVTEDVVVSRDELSVLGILYQEGTIAVTLVRHYHKRVSRFQSTWRVTAL